MIIEFVNLKDESRELQLNVREWRNSIDVARYFQISAIDVDTHKNWLASLNMKKPETIAFLIKYASKYVGLVYFSNIGKINKLCDWGMYIHVVDLRGQGVGTKTLEWSIDFARNDLKLNKMRLEVLASNLKAIKLYEKLGFKLVTSKKENVLCYEIIL